MTTICVDRQALGWIVACQVVEADQWCHRRECQAGARDMLIRRLTNEPLGWRPTPLEVTVRRHRCAGCAHVRRQETTAAREPRAGLSRRACGCPWGVVCQYLILAQVADTERADGAWSIASDAGPGDRQRLLMSHVIGSQLVLG